MKEMWKTIPDYHDYMASNLGRIKSHKYCRGSNKRILRPQIQCSGYLLVTLCRNKNRKGFLIHRLVYSAFNGILPEGIEIHHIDGNKKNNKLKNLKAMCLNKHKSISVKGIKNHHAELNECDVLIIRGLENLSQKKIAKTFNISQSTISKIRNNKTWVLN